MPMRNSNEEVHEITDFTRDCTPFIQTADLLVDEHLAGKGLSDARLKLISLYLAAHFATLTEERGPLSSSSMGESTERIHNVYAGGFRSTRFGQQAMSFDITSTLAQLSYNAEQGAKLPAQLQVI